MASCEECGCPGELRDVHDGNERQSLCEPCAALVDSDRSIRVSPLECGDLELVMAWRSHPKVYDRSRQQDGPLNWDEHVTWFESRDPERQDFILHYDGRRVGVVSLNTHDEVSIYLGDFSAHGHGVATTALDWLTERFENRVPLVAEINEDNEASKQLFTKCGFQQEEQDGKWLKYVYES